MTFTKEYMDFGGSVYFYDKVDKLPKAKENAVLLYLSVICRSWTFDRMTEKEKENCVNVFLRSSECGKIKGNFDARWNVLQLMYDSFLEALDYRSNPADWRRERVSV